jgi:hypothetical protein
MVVFAREYNGAFPGWAQGSWMYFRTLDTGDALRLRIFPRSDPAAYLQLRPLGNDKCQLDVVIQEAYLVRGLPLGISMERLLTAPLGEVLRAAGDRIPRRYFDINSALYEDSRNFVSKVRGGLGALEFRDDGAIDENGNYVFIESLESQSHDTEAGLNCSGFAKWVVDGILRPLTGERLPIGPLKAPFGERGSGFTAPYEELRDPFFGLDWIRNLASIAGKVLRAPAFGDLAEIEVRDAPFSAVIRRERQGPVVRPFPGYLNDVGFDIEGIHPLLYTLAIDEPGRIYLASVNAEMGAPTTADNPRGLPRMRQYFHVAVLVPYFNEYGNFRVAIFESAEETQFNTFKTRYPSNHSVNLVRIPIETSFDP